MSENSRPLPVDVTISFKMEADSSNEPGATIAENGTERTIKLPEGTTANFASNPEKFGLITFTAAGVASRTTA